VKDCEIDLDECIAKAPLYIKILGSYDIVIGMDWLETHEEIFNYKNKELLFVDDLGQKRTLVGMNQGVSLRFIASLQLKKSMRKGCTLYAVLSMNDKEDTLKIKSYLVVSEFMDVFLE
jgi:hypothetical protein